MDYYNEKKRAFMDIKTLATKQKEIYNDIFFHITEKYGFGEKIIKEYIETLIERGLVSNETLKSKLFEV